MKIIPAIDIINGQCVRLSQGDYDRKKVYSDNPLDIAKDFENNGITHLHLVDLDGAKSKQVVNIGVLENITKNTKLHVDFGGGVKTDEDLEKVLKSGAKQVTAGSIAVKNSEKVKSWVEKYGPDKIILGADVKDKKIAINGWTEESDLELIDFIRDFYAIGVRYVICTDISKDGMLAGPATELYKEILTHFPGLKLIASGGVSNINDLKELAKAKLYGAIVGKAIYEGKITLTEINEFNKAENVK